MKKIAAVIGPSNPSKDLYNNAIKVGEILADCGFVVLTGGRGGIMEGAMKGAKNRGGLTIGVLPGSDKDSANPYVDIVLATGLYHFRNYLVVQFADLVVVGGISSGTLTELTMAHHLGKKVVGIGEFQTPVPVQLFKVPEELKEWLTS